MPLLFETASVTDVKLMPFLQGLPLARGAPHSLRHAAQVQAAAAGAAARCAAAAPALLWLPLFAPRAILHLLHTLSACGEARTLMKHDNRGLLAGKPGSRDRPDARAAVLEFSRSLSDILATEDPG